MDSLCGISYTWFLRKAHTINVLDLLCVSEQSRNKEHLSSVLIQVNRSKHSITETQVMEQRIFSFGINEQLLMLHNANDVNVNKRAHPP